MIFEFEKRKGPNFTRLRCGWGAVLVLVVAGAVLVAWLGHPDVAHDILRYIR